VPDPALEDRVGAPGSTQLRLSWRRLAAESLAIVASILLAFTIDASWQAKVKNQQVRAELTALLGEIRTNQRLVDERLQYHAAIRDATIALLSVASDGAPVVSPDSVDHLLADATWWGGADALEMAVLDAFVVDGTLADVEDSDLLRALTRWRRSVQRLALGGNQDYQAYAEVWMPFLRSHAYLPQISNALTHVPGNDEPIDSYASVPTTTSVFDHTPLLGRVEFQNILVQKKWAQEDFVREYNGLKGQLVELGQLLEASVR
jgi:hypothetical protein